MEICSQLLIISLLFLSGVDYSRQLDYKKSNEILNIVEPFYKENEIFIFYKAHNYFKLREKDKAEFYLDKINERSKYFDNISLRYKNIASLMAYELSSWKDDDLYDIARAMRQSRDALGNSYANKGVQITQQEIVDKLTKMINKMEEEMSNNGNGGSSDKEQDKDNQSTRTSRNSQSPAGDSYLPPNVEATGKVRERLLRKHGKEWGRLPQRERDVIVQELTQGLTPSHREAVENYFRKLSQ